MELVMTKVAEYLTFNLDTTEYAINIASIRNILGRTDVSHLAGMPEYILGVVRDRDVLPIFEFRLKFNMGRTVWTRETCIIVIEMNSSKGIVCLGGVVDSVNDVIELIPGDLEIRDRVAGDRMRADFIIGIGKKNERLITIIDPNRIFQEEELIRYSAIRDSKIE